MDEAGSSSAGAPSSAGGQAGATRRPVACIVLGMAGSGKTTLMQRLNSHLHEAKRPYYLINLDPAVLDTPFGANIDIRDTVNYKEVMKQYSLGPNGGILTSLNLFATKFHEVLGLVEARAEELDFVLLDTPGQIEIFTWSASGAIISESLAASMPTVVVYVVDTPRCSSAVTFMSNMLYACSILYKTKLPLLLVFNKTDVTPHAFAQESPARESERDCGTLMAHDVHRPISSPHTRAQPLQSWPHQTAHAVPHRPSARPTVDTGALSPPLLRRLASTPPHPPPPPRRPG